MNAGEDSFWRRPAGVDGSLEPQADPPPPASATYAGPPRTAPPPPGWRPPQVVQPPPPRVLPPQDHVRIDREEQAARTLTTGIGLVAGAICLVLLLILCARAAFS
jgi:hypothetical protein